MEFSYDNNPGNENIGAVLVCGAGIAGIQASLDLAESGFKVYLLDASAAIGGRMAQLDKTFPTGDCAMCILSPKLVECARNRNIEIITLADIQDVSGKPGNFSVKIRQNPRYVDMKKCDACGDCADVCPVSLPSEFDRGLDVRKAIFQPYPQAIPNVFSISKASGTAPCKAGCPAGVNVQGSVALIGAGKFEEAYELIRQRCPFRLPADASAGIPARANAIAKRSMNPCRFAPLNGLSEIQFVKIEISLLRRYCSRQIVQDGRIAVIGGGPAGLTAATDLALMGYRVTIFEAKRIWVECFAMASPLFACPKMSSKRKFKPYSTWEWKSGQYAHRQTQRAFNCRCVGERESRNGGIFHAVFVATGAWENRKLGIPGEGAKGFIRRWIFFARPIPEMLPTWVPPSW